MHWEEKVGGCIVFFSMEGPAHQRWEGTAVDMNTYEACPRGNAIKDTVKLWNRLTAEMIRLWTLSTLNVVLSWLQAIQENYKWQGTYKVPLAFSQCSMEIIFVIPSKKKCLGTGHKKDPFSPQILQWSQCIVLNGWQHVRKCSWAEHIGNVFMWELFVTVTLADRPSLLLTLECLRILKWKRN